MSTFPVAAGRARALWLALGAVAAIVLVLAVAQIVLPAIAAQRRGDRVARYAQRPQRQRERSAGDNALWGDMERVSVSADTCAPHRHRWQTWCGVCAGPIARTSPRPAWMWSSPRSGVKNFHCALSKFAKHGDDLTVRAGVQGTDLRVALLRPA